MNELYAERARLYDLIYHWKDYASEAERVRSILLDEGIPDGSRVVEAACGTGQYLGPLSRWYEVEGYDLHPAMVREAVGKGLRASVADMREHRFQADAILCSPASGTWRPRSCRGWPRAGTTACPRAGSCWSSPGSRPSSRSRGT